MTRKLKTFGIALVAVFAISAVVASGAMATNDVFESGSTPVTLTGAQEGSNQFVLAGQSVECTTATFHGTVSASPVSQITGITPTYGGCTYAGKTSNLDMNGCTYTITGTTDANGHAMTKLVCPAGQAIAFTADAIECVVTIREPGASNGSQTATKGVTYTNVGTGTTEELLIHATAKFKVQSEQGSYKNYGITCASLTSTTTEWLGTIRVTAEADPSGGHVPITVH